MSFFDPFPSRPSQGLGLGFSRELEDSDEESPVQDTSQNSIFSPHPLLGSIIKSSGWQQTSLTPTKVGRAFQLDDIPAALRVWGYITTTRLLSDLSTTTTATATTTIATTTPNTATISSPLPSDQQRVAKVPIQVQVHLHHHDTPVNDDDNDEDDDEDNDDAKENKRRAAEPPFYRDHFPALTSQKALRHRARLHQQDPGSPLTPLSRSRLSPQDNWRPMMRIVYCLLPEDEKEAEALLAGQVVGWGENRIRRRRQPVCFCLFDGSDRVNKGAVAAATAEAVEGGGLDEVLEEVFGVYLERLEKGGKGYGITGDGESEGVKGDGDAAVKEVLRGRRRKLARRHGLLTGLERGGQAMTNIPGLVVRLAPAPVASPAPGLGFGIGHLTSSAEHAEIIPRGRLRRRVRRHGLGGLHLQHATAGYNPTLTQQHQNTAAAITPSKPALKSNPASPFLTPVSLPGRTRLSDEVFSAITTSGPVIWLQTDQIQQANGFEPDLLVVPLYSRSDDDNHQNSLDDKTSSQKQRPIGRLVLPKDNTESWGGESWLERLDSGWGSFGVGRLFALGHGGLNTGVDGSLGSGTYWAKFTVEAFDEFIDGLRSSVSAEDTIGDVSMALAASFHNPPLIFPDVTLGPVADTRETLKTWFPLDPNGLPGDAGPDTARFLHWNTDLAGNWRYERRVELKGNFDTQISRYHGILSDSWPEVYRAIQQLSSGTDVANYDLAETEYQFALHLQAMEGEVMQMVVFGKDYEWEDPGYPELPQKPGDYWKLTILTRELFYGSRYHRAIPIHCQTEIASRIAHIAADPTCRPLIRAHAALELGICLLSGFGIDRDIDRGLECMRTAADAGSEKAQAVVSRLTRAYGRGYSPSKYEDRYEKVLLVAAVEGYSFWAAEELKQRDRDLFDEILRKAVLEYPESGFSLGYFERVIKGRFDLSNPELLREQIGTEFDFILREEEQSRQRRTATVSPRFQDQIPEDPWQASPAFPSSQESCRGADALGLFGSEPDPDPFEAPGEDPGEEDIGPITLNRGGLGLFSTSEDIVPEDVISTTSQSGLGLFSYPEDPLTADGDALVAPESGLGLFSAPQEPALGEDVDFGAGDTGGLGLFSAGDDPVTDTVFPDASASGLGIFSTPRESSGVPGGLGLFSASEEPPGTEDTVSPIPGILITEHVPRSPGTHPLPIMGRTLSPKEFLNDAIRWACCYGSVATLRVLLTEQARLVPGLFLAPYVSVALATGRGDMALALLSEAAGGNRETEQAAITKDTSPYLLFQLHHLPADQVAPVAEAIVAHGFDVNEQVDIYPRYGTRASAASRYTRTAPSASHRFHQDHLSVFCESLPQPGGLPPTSQDPPPGAYYRHWAPELRGRSLTPLRWAVHQGNQEVVRVLLDLGAEFPQVPDTQEEGKMVHVLEEPCFNVGILKMFMDRHGLRCGQAVFAETPLGLITMEPDSPERRLRFSGRSGTIEGLDEVLPLLREYQPNSDGQLFWAAAMNGHVDIVRYLIREGVSIEARHNGQTPLHTAVLHGQKEVFSLLLDHGANARAVTSEKGMSVLHMLFWTPKLASTEIFMLNELYRKIGSVAVSEGTFGATVQPIHLAVINGRVEAVKRLVELGVDTTVPIGQDIMPFFRGCFRHAGWQPPGVLDEALYEAYARPVTPVSLDGLTPVGIVLARHDIHPPRDIIDILRSLVLSDHLKGRQTFAVLYTRPSAKQTIFHVLPCLFPFTETDPTLLSDLISHLTPLFPTIDLINIPDADGDTPLHYAALFGALGNHDNLPVVVDRLLSLGAKPHARNRWGFTPATMRTAYFMWKAGLGAEDGPGSWNAKTIEFSPFSRSASVKPHVMRNLDESSEKPEIFKMMGQLLHGARAREVWDLNGGQWIRFAQEIVVKLVTEADMRSGFLTENR
ncbi:hypothetical protein B0J18DRAFT_418308 [Chaetomium sp. MPI-SDFR-AT-0129]|nr:hypothetical protein B0J18DRAFT_418308 [Chaetomium sp. MPI-SDFR-AT-0129]